MKMMINRYAKIINAETKNGKDWYLRIQIGHSVYGLPISQETLERR